MEKYVCNVCGYVYDPALGDPENGVAPGTSFNDLPDDWPKNRLKPISFLSHRYWLPLHSPHNRPTSHIRQ